MQLVEHGPFDRPTGKAAQIEQQAETIKALWVQNAQLQKRVDTLQKMADWRGARIEQLEAEQTVQAIAERHFR